MGRAVDLDDQLAGERDEIDYVPVNRMLPTELPTVDLAVSKRPPQLRLGAGLGSAELTRSFLNLSIPLTPRHQTRLLPSLAWKECQIGQARFGWRDLSPPGRGIGVLLWDWRRGDHDGRSGVGHD
jgi:hypothetical protein